VRWFETDNRRYRVDIDSPEDLERFAERTGHVLRWPAALEAAASA
jgi:molybdenum cofactor cytidylyltransferase